MAIIKRLGKLPLENWGKGVITHEDQKKLDFRVFYVGNTHYYFGVQGESADAIAWATRVGATTTTKAEIQTASDSEAPADVVCEFGFTHPYQKPVINDTV